MKLNYHLLKFYVLALVVNFVLLISVIDIHFPVLDPPLIRNQCLLHTNTKQVSKRLVIILSDGLRADSLYNVTSSNSFLRSMMETGAWGKSIAAAPTLTREGISSILTGKPSPSSELVRQISNFFSGHEIEMADNLLNQKYTNKVFFAGARPVLAYFGYTPRKEKWITRVWNKLNNQNSCKDFKCYDEHAFQSLHMFLNKPSAKTNNIIFFLYLYGQDACSHKLGPKNKICQDEIKFIDKRIKELYKEIEHRYNDSSTTYLFTSDHGLTDWGVHGWVSKEETQTPFILWGHGVTKTGKLKSSKSLEFDINQVDLAPILSIIRGTPIPKESIGVFHPEILSYDEELKAKGMLCNVRGLEYLIEGYLENLKSDKRFQEMKNKTKVIEEFLISGNFSQVILLGKDIVYGYLRIYYHITQNYYKGHLNVVVSSIYIGWGLFLFSKYLLTWLKHEKDSRITCMLRQLLIYFIIGIPIVLVIFKWPIRFSIYYYLSIGCWIFFLKNALLIILHFFKAGCVPTGSLPSLSQLFEMFSTFLLSFIVILCVTKPLINQVSLIFLTLNFYSCSETTKWLPIPWIGSALILLFIVHYPIIMLTPNLFYVQLSALCWIAFIVFYIFYVNCSQSLQRDYLWSFASLFCTTIAIVNLTLIVSKGENKRWISWFLLLSILFPIMSAQKNIQRLFHIIFSLGIPFILMSVNYEALGFLAYAIHAMSWVCLDKSDNSDILRAFYFLFYVWLGFFAVGNNDLPTSYSIRWTRCFFSEVSYYLIPLIMYKQFMPVLIITACIITIYNKLDRCSSPALIWYLFLNNGIAFYFFLCVRNNGQGETHEGHSHMRHILSQVLPMAVITVYPIVSALININYKNPAFLKKLAMKNHQGPKLNK